LTRYRPLLHQKFVEIYRELNFLTKQKLADQIRVIHKNNRILSIKRKIIKKQIEQLLNNNPDNNTNNTYEQIQPKIHEYINYFTNYHDLKRFKKLNNKKSFGLLLDNIPNIVLKYIPLKLVCNYTIIFNNLLNYSLFLSKWKTTKIVAILKKDKH